MWANIKQHYFRRQRSKNTCHHCGQRGTSERPLMFSVEDNNYYHYPTCENVAEYTPDRHDMVFND
jgi:hypothetical protein